MDCKVGIICYTFESLKKFNTFERLRKNKILSMKKSIKNVKRSR